MSAALSSGNFSPTNEIISINRSFIFPFETITLPPNDGLVGAVEFALLAFVAVPARVNLLITTVPSLDSSTTSTDSPLQPQYPPQ